MNETAHETDWAADRKVGFALGILLVGVVAALFFRNEPPEVNDVPVVERADELNERLRDRNVTVYGDGDVVGSGRSAESESDLRWTRPDLLNELEDLPVDAPLAIGDTEPLSTEPNQPNLPSSLNRPTQPIAAVDGIIPQILPATTADAANDDAVVLPGESIAAQHAPDHDSVSELTDVTESYDEYTIQYGDTLSGIADEFLGSSGRYREIYDANKDRMASPDRLRVGTAIRIPRL